MESNLVLPEVNAIPRDASRSQWYTDPRTARRVVDWACLDWLGDVDPAVSSWTVLEPSAGDGALLRALEQYVPRQQMWSIDIDPRNVELLQSQGYQADCMDFLELQPTGRLDLVIMNPPYEDGQAEVHIIHALNFAPRVVALAPMTTLEGVTRSTRLWSHVELQRMVVFSKRPKFGHVAGKGKGGGETAMCVFDIRRAKRGKEQPLKMDSVSVEFWR